MDPIEMTAELYLGGRQESLQIMEREGLWGRLTSERDQLDFGLVVEEDLDTAWLYQPGIAGDDMMLPLPPRWLRVPWSGPRFVRFEVMDEAEVRAILGRNRAPRPLAQRTEAAAQWMRDLPVPCAIHTDNEWGERTLLVESVTEHEGEPVINYGQESALSVEDVLEEWPWKVEAQRPGELGYQRDVRGDS